MLNPGATAYESPLAPEPVVVAGPTDPLELIAIADIEDGYPRDGSGDKDEDNLTDEEEVLVPGYGTDPCEADTDGDGLNDDVEVAGCTFPLDDDTDDDGLLDGVETNNGPQSYVSPEDTGTDPCDDDTDDDLCDDGVEVDNGTDPTDDADFDCL